MESPKIVNCTLCGIAKPQYEYHKKGSGRYRSFCKQCYKSKWQYRLLSTISSRCSGKNIKMPHGRIRNSKFTDNTITIEYLNTLHKQQNGLCYWLKIPLDFTMNDKFRKPSIDRIDNDKGYIKGNVVLSCLFANTGRRDATVDEFETFINKYINK